MGYTAAWAGYATAGFGMAAMIAAPVTAQLSSRLDPRWLVFTGVLWLALLCLYRTGSNTDMTFAQVAFRVFLMGFGMSLFFLPLTSAALGSVPPGEVASAAGLQNFVRTLAGAVGTSVVNTVWQNGIARNHAEIAGVLHDPHATIAAYVRSGLSETEGLNSLEHLVNDQAIMLSTNQVFTGCAVIFVVAACAIWLSPRPKHVADTSHVH